VVRLSVFLFGFQNKRVDGTLLEAWASVKSFQPKVNFRELLIHCLSDTP